MRERKDKKKKKLQKSKKPDSHISKSDNEETPSIKPEVTNIINILDLKDNSTVYLDTTYSNHLLDGTKGHQNFIINQSIEEGIFYFEVEIKSSKFNISKDFLDKKLDEFSKKYYENLLLNPSNFASNCRIGITDSINDLDIPVGVDKNSYSIRINDGAVISEGNALGLNNKITEGDILGILVNIKPPMPEFLKQNVEDVYNKENSNNLSNENIAEEDNKENKESNKEKKMNFESFIKFYKNGNELPIGINGLYEGNFKVIVTLYNFACVEIDIGNNLKYFDKICFDGNVMMLKDFIK